MQRCVSVHIYAHMELQALVNCPNSTRNKLEAKVVHPNLTERQQWLLKPPAQNLSSEIALTTQAQDKSITSLT